MLDDKIRQTIDRPVGKAGTWLWQCGIILPDGQPTEYPICPFCTTSPFREFGAKQTLPDRCPECNAKLKLEE